MYAVDHAGTHCLFFQKDIYLGNVINKKTGNECRLWRNMRIEGATKETGQKAINSVKTEDPETFLLDYLKKYPTAVPADFDAKILGDTTSDIDRAFFVEVSDMLRDHRVREIIIKNTAL